MRKYIEKTIIQRGGTFVLTDFCKGANSRIAFLHSYSPEFWEALATINVRNIQEVHLDFEGNGISFNFFYDSDWRNLECPNRDRPVDLAALLRRCTRLRTVHILHIRHTDTMEVFAILLEALGERNTVQSLYVTLDIDTYDVEEDAGWKNRIATAVQKLDNLRSIKSYLNYGQVHFTSRDRFLDYVEDGTVVYEEDVNKFDRILSMDRSSPFIEGCLGKKSLQTYHDAFFRSKPENFLKSLPNLKSIRLREVKGVLDEPRDDSCNPNLEEISLTIDKQNVTDFFSNERACTSWFENLKVLRLEIGTEYLSSFDFDALQRVASKVERLCISLIQVQRQTRQDPVDLQLQSILSLKNLKELHCDFPYYRIPVGFIAEVLRSHQGLEVLNCRSNKEWVDHQALAQDQIEIFKALQTNDILTELTIPLLFGRLENLREALLHNRKLRKLVLEYGNQYDSQTIAEVFATNHFNVKIVHFQDRDRYLELSRFVRAMEQNTHIRELCLHQNVDEVDDWDQMCDSISRLQNLQSLTVCVCRLIRWTEEKLESLGRALEENKSLVHVHWFGKDNYYMIPTRLTLMCNLYQVRNKLLAVQNDTNPQVIYPEFLKSLQPNVSSMYVALRHLVDHHPNVFQSEEG
jgi:hypothetical protein